MGEIAGFITSRLDEEQADLEEMLGGALVQGYLRHHGAELLADIEGKRRLLERYRAAVEDFVHVDETAYEFARRELLEDVLAELALKWADHDDYKEMWRP